MRKARKTIADPADDLMRQLREAALDAGRPDLVPKANARLGAVLHALKELDLRLVFRPL